jgi:hypothetical protein
MHSPLDPHENGSGGHLQERSTRSLASRTNRDQKVMNCLQDFY